MPLNWRGDPPAPDGGVGVHGDDRLHNYWHSMIVRAKWYGAAWTSGGVPMPAQPYSRRLHDLEEAFAGLAAQLPEGAVKEGLSLLHAMQQELWRSLRPGAPAAAESGLTIA